MVYADLHVHTTASDGSLTLDTLPAAAASAGVGAVAVTDHDRLHPDLGEPVTERDGVTIVRGIELRVEARGTGQVDLLGYGVESTPALAAELDRLQEDRIERGRAIVECVEDRLGVSLDVAAREGLGRPHVARAIGEHPDAEHDYQDAFDRLIGSSCPCYVPRDVPSFERGASLLGAACGLVGLAHPLRYDDPSAALALAADLDAVERYYPYDRPVGRSDGTNDTDRIDRAIDEYDLVATGGSDAHDEVLGKAGLSAREFGRIETRL